MKKIVLDTSALITLIEEEPGAEEVEKIIQETLDGEHQVFISIIAKIELFYISVQEQSLSIAKQRMQLINDLLISQVEKSSSSKVVKNHSTTSQLNHSTKSVE